MLGVAIMVGVCWLKLWLTLLLNGSKIMETPLSFDSGVIETIIW